MHEKKKKIETVVELRNSCPIYREVYDICTMNVIYLRCFWQPIFCLLRLTDASRKRRTNKNNNINMKNTKANF